MRLKPGAKVFLAIVIVVLFVAGAYRFGWLNPVVKLVAPERRPAGTIEQSDWTFGNQGAGQTQRGQDGQAATQSPPTTESAPLARPIKVGIVTYGGFAGGLLENDGVASGKECDYYKDYGLEVEFQVIDDLGAMADAFKAGGDKGGLDLMATTADMFALQYAAMESLKPVTVMQTDWSRGADAIAVAKGITNASGLRGKRVAVAEASPSHFLLLYVLTQAGMTQNDIKPQFTASAMDAAQLFKAGKVDACVAWSPDVYIAAGSREGATILASTREATSLLGGTIVARGDFCNQHPSELTKFIRGWMDGVKKCEDDPDAAAAVLVKTFKVTNDDAVGMLGDLKLQGAEGNRQFFKLGGDTLTGYDDLWISANKIWKKIGLLENTVRPDLTRNTYFLDEATKGMVPKTLAKPTEEFKFTAPSETVKKQPPIVTKRITVYFATASYALDPNAKQVLEQAAELAQTFGSTYIRISGNTDSVGSRQMNVELSRKRAQAVVNYLVSKYGFPKDKFIVVGNGPDKPVASNDTEDGRAKNRRTDFEVIPQEQN